MTAQIIHLWPRLKVDNDRPSCTSFDPVELRRNYLAALRELGMKGDIIEEIDKEFER